MWSYYVVTGIRLIVHVVSFIHILFPPELKITKKKKHGKQVVIDKSECTKGESVIEKKRKKNTSKNTRVYMIMINRMP